MMARFGEWLHRAIPICGRTGFSLLTRVSLMVVLVMTASAYADNEKRDYFGDYRVPSGFVYSEATITPDKARELAREHVVLTLVNVTEVSPAVAEALVIPGGDTVLTLPALATLDEEAATILAQRPGRLRLWGLKSVTPEVAAALVAHDGARLELNGIKEISPAAARALAKGRRSSGISVGLIDLPLAVDWHSRPLQKVDPLHGKPSQTRWQILEQAQDKTRLLLQPLSGRTHQLRVHLQAIGHPIVGDALYGADAGPQAPRLLLHASALMFTHPLSGQSLHIESPPPF